MGNGKPMGWLIEWQTGHGDWRACQGGKFWKTRQGVEKARDRWVSDQAEYGWHPTVRIVELEKSYNARGVAFARVRA